MAATRLIGRGAASPAREVHQTLPLGPGGPAPAATQGSSEAPVTEGSEVTGEAASHAEEAPGCSCNDGCGRPSAENRKVGGPLEELLSRDAPVQAAAEYLAFLAEHPEYAPERVPELVRRAMLFWRRQAAWRPLV